MKFTQEQIDELEQLSGIGYTVRQIAMYFDIPWSDLQMEYENTDSSFHYHFKRGILISQARINMSNVKLAQNGNVTAAALVVKSMRRSKYQQVKNEIYNGRY